MHTDCQHAAPRRTRLAPSPTGALHLGNARTFAINWAIARKQDWTIVLRIEDLDHPRVKPETIDQAREDLAWLGLTWDEEVPLQSACLQPYVGALRQLGASGRIFRCDRSRRDIAQAQSAPHEREHGLHYDPSLRPDDAGTAVAAPEQSATWRFMVAEDDITVNDAFAGSSTFDLSRVGGDFPVWTASGGPAYQLAVAVDDARHGITDVIRGDDLLPSAARQQAIQDALNLPTPQWWHVPLVRGADGRRLAKRHGDTRLATFREAGVPAEQVLGLMGYWCGMTEAPTPMTAADFLAGLDVTAIPSHDITLTLEHIAWLTG
ncbi:MAG: glutamate--tRNA ligase family protein [Phycisphaerales bacterium]|nr:glutamate--tRNA ligase family protein [Phycisphaerales bacterium]